MIVYHGILCRCANGSGSAYGDASSRSLASSAPNSALAAVPLTDPSARILILARKQLQPIHEGGKAETDATELQSDDASARSMPVSLQARPLAGHSDRCARVLVRQTATTNSMPVCKSEETARGGASACSSIDFAVASASVLLLMHI